MFTNKLFQLLIHSVWIHKKSDQQASIHASWNEIACDMYKVQSLPVLDEGKAGWRPTCDGRPTLSNDIRRGDHWLSDHLWNLFDNSNGYSQKHPLWLHQWSFMDGNKHTPRSFQRWLLLIHLNSKRSRWRDTPILSIWNARRPAWVLWLSFKGEFPIANGPSTEEERARLRQDRIQKQEEHHAFRVTVTSLIGQCDTSSNARLVCRWKRNRYNHVEAEFEH